MHFDTLIFIALILVAAFLRWISQQAEKAQRKTDERSAGAGTIPRPQTHDETDEERIRRFLEALGQPTSSKPPPRVIPRRVQKPTVAPRRRPILSPLPPLTTVPPDLPPEVPVVTERPILVSADMPQPVEQKRFESRILKTPQLRPASADVTIEKGSLTLSRPTVFPETGRTPIISPELATLLKTERGLRAAIILREIFGPPRSLQPFDELKSV